jgi:hypothetical protein
MHNLKKNIFQGALPTSHMASRLLARLFLAVGETTAPRFLAARRATTSCNKTKRRFFTSSALVVQQNEMTSVQQAAAL